MGDWFMLHGGKHHRSEIARLIESGIVPREIGILHEQKHVITTYQSLVPRGVQIHEIRRQTGLEYKAVLVPQVQQLFERKQGVSWEEDKARMLLKYYMTMTRARDHLYMLYTQRWPKLLESLDPYVNRIDH